MVAVASTANLELDQLLNEASSEDGEDSRESANLEDILASDDSNASEDEAVSRIDRRTSSEADRLHQHGGREPLGCGPQEVDDE